MPQTSVRKCVSRLGSKRNYLTEAEIATITQNYGAFEAVDTLGAWMAKLNSKSHSPAKFLTAMNLAIAV